MVPTSSQVLIHLKTMFNRITCTRTSLLLFFATVGFCFTQGVVQAFLFSVDQDYSALTSLLLDAGQVPYDSRFAYLHRTGDKYDLRLCTSLPASGNLEYNTTGCVPTFNSGGPATGIDTAHQFPNGPATNITFLSVSQDPTQGADITMTFSDYNIVLNHQCLEILIYPDQVLKNAKREELALMGSQFWLLFTTTYGIVSESVPHLMAALVVRFVGMIWSAYAIWRTVDVNDRFDHLVRSEQSPCHTDLYPDYLIRRRNYEIPDLVFSILAVIACSYMSWRLIKMYKERTLGRIGTTTEIQQIYRFYMAVLACLQLAVYFLLTSLSLWLDQVITGAISQIATFRVLYKAQAGLEIALLLPWVALGWFALTREHRLAAAGFVAWAAFLLVTNALDFYSVAFRWTYIQWPFFGGVTTASLVILVFTIGFAGVCTARFGRGFANYLHVERVLAESDFAADTFVNSPTSSDVEKAPIPWEYDEPKPMERVSLPSPPPATLLPRDAMVPTYLRPFGE